MSMLQPMALTPYSLLLAVAESDGFALAAEQRVLFIFYLLFCDINITTLSKCRDACSD